MHWSRQVDGAWRHVLLEGLEAVVPSAEIGCTLALAALYAGLAFRPQPRLVREDADPD